MALLNIVETYLNITDYTRGQDNATEHSLHPPHNYYAMFYSILIFSIIFGNVLVCLAVIREKALQTTTNYLVVSLAVADLLVATLVMPWVVYLEVTAGDWTFSRTYCDIFVTMDVMMCTASILNLCAISIDRYTAVVMPVQYNTTHSSRRRVNLMIITVWVLAFAVSCPLLFGFNTTDNPSICSISNPEFVIYSSIVSFYLPFVVTVLVYIRIYVVLQKRRKRIISRRSQRTISSETYCTPSQYLNMDSTVKDKTVLAEPEANGKTNTNEEHISDPLDPMSPCLRKEKTLSSENKLLTKSDTPNYCSLSHAPFVKTEKDTELDNNWRSTACRVNRYSSEVKSLPNGRYKTSLRMSPKRRSTQLRERKATQMLAIVLGVFIICWLPFFVTHVINTHCKICHVPLEVYSATTWLGYINSALNPLIYTTFNVEFRKAFIKILCC
ncbi:D(3) dopamine receptor [Protopterus annectens]|uniref:D(3) dopamine receptor n=1 Tax=Protopterus annectens TaxID=7888 RepID=UPI001CFB1159|nr:D(3) dopamine receptor [Protopterus annectens]